MEIMGSKFNIYWKNSHAKVNVRKIYLCVNMSVVYRNAKFVVFNVDPFDIFGSLTQQIKNLIIIEHKQGKNVNVQKERNIY